jgi:hypothetical protein
MTNESILDSKSILCPLIGIAQGQLKKGENLRLSPHKEGGDAKRYKEQGRQGTERPKPE